MVRFDGLCPSFALRTPDCVRLRRGGSNPIKNTKQQKTATIIVTVFTYGADGGIRTHGGFLPNAFRVRPVMTASIHLLIQLAYFNKLKIICQVIKTLFNYQNTGFRHRKLFQRISDLTPA